MLLELAGFLFGVFVVLIFFAKFTARATFGIFAGVLLLVLGLWIYVDGIQIPSGTLTHSQETGLTILSCGDTNCSTNTSMNETLSISKTINETTTYQNIPTTPYMPANQVIGLLFILLSIYVMFDSVLAYRVRK